jgi:transcriptional regulator with GAF, ATPase, and Fis domain
MIEPRDLGLPFSEALLHSQPNVDWTTDTVRGPVMASSLGGAFSLEEIEREHIARVVAQAPSFEAAARILGIDSTTLQCKRKRYGLA